MLTNFVGYEFFEKSIVFEKIPEVFQNSSNTVHFVVRPNILKLVSGIESTLCDLQISSSAKFLKKILLNPYKTISNINPQFCYQLNALNGNAKNSKNFLVATSFI